MTTAAIRILSLLALLSVATAKIPSTGLRTAESARLKLKDRDFKISPRKGIILNTPAFEARIADLTNYRALSLVDTQFYIARITLRSHKTFPTHFHPRGSEVLTVLKGAIRVSFRMENGRVVRNKLHVGHTTVFPQGLPHDIKCVSRRDCLMLATLNTADPGNVFV